MDEKTDRPETLNVRMSSLERLVVRALEDHFGTDASSVVRHGVLDLGRSVGITTENVEELLKKRRARKH